jgi:hypothetical protein
MRLWLGIGLAVVFAFALACGGGGGGGGGADTTAPTISSTVPANGATDVAVGSAVTVTFSEAIDETTLDTTSFSVSGGVTGTVTYTAATRTATFTPDADLSYDTTYTVTVTTDVLDLAANALATDNSWSFTTADAPDTTPPTVTEMVPDDLDVNVVLNTSVTATFSEAMTAATITTASFTLNDGTSDVAGTVDYDAGSMTATFTPGADLAADTPHTATITTDAQDAAGNPLAADHVWTFTTGNTADATPPEVVTRIPDDGTEGVALRTLVTAEFSEPMRASTITTITFTVSDGTGPVAGTVTYEAANLAAVFTPALPLDGSTEYTVTVTTGAQDLANNGLAADDTWTFVTTGTWEQLGLQVSPAGAESEDPTMLIVDDTPAVGYRHASFEVNLHLWDENGLTWGATETDPSGGECNSSIHSTPAFCSNGDTIFMAYSHAGEGGGAAEFYDRIFVYSWTAAGSWSPAAMNGGEEVSVVWNAVDGGADADEPAIAIREGVATPVVAWVEVDVAPILDGDNDVWAAVVSDLAAVRGDPLSRNDTDGDYATDVRCLGMTVRNNIAYLAQWEQHHDEQDRTDLYVTESDGGAVTNLGGAIASDYDSNNLSVPSLATRGNRVYVAYSITNSSGVRNVYVKQWHNNAWTTLGDGPVSAFTEALHYDSANPSLLVVDGTLTIAWEESPQIGSYSIYTATYDEDREEWLLDGDQIEITPANDAHDPSLAYDDANGYLYVTFEEFTDGWAHVFVKRKELAPAAP